MPTWTCKAILLISALGLVLGATFIQEWLVLCSLCVIVWLGYIWIQFNIALLRSPQGACYFLRYIDGKPRNKHSLIQGNSVTIDVHAQFSGAYSILRLDIEHMLPTECQYRNLTNSLVVNPLADKKYHWQFEVKANVLGKIVFPGYSIKLADMSGLFERRAFISQPVELTVLPVVMKSETTISTTKNHNVQLFAGHHRYRRPGLGTEILGIRDYQIGDPPRSIAWKATARFNKLMTCEYESEVPVRANIVCDLSSYQFIGRPNVAAADHVINAASSLANLLLSDRDPTSCSVFSETGITKIRAGVGNRQLNRIVEMMLSWDPGFASPVVCDASHLVDLVWQNCILRHPDMFDTNVNRFPERNIFLKALVWFSASAATLGKRKQLAHIFAVLFDLEVGNIARLQHDDEYFFTMCHRYQDKFPFAINRFMGVPNLGAIGQMKMASIKNLCKLLLEFSKRANDNELFVIVGLQPDFGEQIDELENVVKVLRGAHHRVLFVSVATPDQRPQWIDQQAANLLIDEHVFDQERSFESFRARLFPYGAKAVFMRSPQLDQRLAAELEILKFGRHRVGK